MLTLITGVPGAGKTLRAVQIIVEIIAENDRLRAKLEKGEELKEGEYIFNVYANIKGLKIDEVQEAPEDWRECESPAKWFYDEAQYTFPAKSNRGLDDNEVISKVATHRHFGVDLFLITQHPQLISSHVRRFVGRHEHLDRRLGSSLVSKYIADELMTVGGSMRKYESDVWNHPKKLFDYYDSANIHIKNARLPRALKYLIVFIIIMLVVFISGSTYVYKFYSKRTVGAIKSTQSTELKVQSTTKSVVIEPQVIYITEQQVKVEESINIYLGCIVSKSRCRCFLHDGVPAHMSYEQCIDVNDDLPVNLLFNSNKS